MRLGATVLMSLFLFGLPAVAQADDTFPGATPFGQIAASGSDFAYTTGDTGRVQLRLGFGPAATTVPVPAARDIRGLDLGTDSRGGKVLVYSRCSSRCDLFVYPLASRKERKISPLSRSACNERNPRMVRGAVAFVREGRRSKSKRLRCTGGIYVQRPGRKLQRASATTASSLDYDGRLLAYNRERSGPGGGSGITTTEIRVLRPGGSSRVLAAGSQETDRGGTAGTLLGDVALDGGQVYWTRSVGDDSTDDETPPTETANIVRRSATSTGASQVLDRAGRPWVGTDPMSPGQDLFVSSIAVAGSRLFYGYGSTAGLIGQVTGTPVFK